MDFPLYGLAIAVFIMGFVGTVLVLLFGLIRHAL